MGMKIVAVAAGLSIAASVSALVFGIAPHLISGQAIAVHSGLSSTDGHAASAPLVVIDPGHGGDDPGADSVYGTHEKDITWQVSSLIAKDLQNKGIRVVLTRGENQNPSLSTRLSYGLSSRAAFFLSVHANEFDASPDVRGSEIHVYNPARLTEKPYPGTRLSAAASHASLAISESIVQQVEKHPVGIPVRSGAGDPTGIRYDVDFVCRLSDGPAALIELGYLSNPSDAKLLTKHDVQARYAQDIADGIADKVLPRTKP